jgi:energy-coupling factor transport system permease protein
MLKDITLGQFFPGTSFMHRLDPRTKLVMLVVYIAALFIAVSWISYAVMFSFLVLCILLSKIPLKSILRSMKPLALILVLTAILNLFLSGGETVWFSFWIIKITKEGVVRAVLMLLRILMLVAGTFLLTYTTSPIALTDGLESLLSPLKKLRLPLRWQRARRRSPARPEPLHPLRARRRKWRGKYCHPDYPARNGR